MKAFGPKAFKFRTVLVWHFKINFRGHRWETDKVSKKFLLWKVKQNSEVLRVQAFEINRNLENRKKEILVPQIVILWKIIFILLSACTIKILGFCSTFQKNKKSFDTLSVSYRFPRKFISTILTSYEDSKLWWFCLFKPKISKNLQFSNWKL